MVISNPYPAATEEEDEVLVDFRAGLTTFAVMAYIIVVNPVILTTGAAITGQNLSFAGVATATCLVAAVASMAMGVWARFPLALAPGMGLNAVVAFYLVANLGLTWQGAMAVIFLEGLVITLLVFSGARQMLLSAVPQALTAAIAGGIGLFILAIGAYEAGFFQVPVEVGKVLQSAPPTAGRLGNLTFAPTALSVVGVLLTSWMLVGRWKGALLLGIVATTILGTAYQYLTGISVSTQPGKAVLPTTWMAPPDFSVIVQLPGVVGLGDPFTKLGFVAAVAVVLAVMLSDFFDTAGTATGIAQQAGLTDEQGQPKGYNRILQVDSLAALGGGLFGSSSATSYIESAAGVAEGGKTGLVSIVVGVLFLIAIPFTPLLAVVPPEATAPALILVGYYMLREVIGKIPWGSVEEGLPALATLTVMPLTWSITNGVGVGVLLYVFLKVVNRKASGLHPLLWVIALAFALYFAFWRGG